ncbi:hypothetical protein [Kineobactrum sediminis]|nr:hypothetical protein [Kineobactrum sediminis]
MTKPVNGTEQLTPGETATIENTLSTPMRISLVSGNDCQVDIELLPGQVVRFSSGKAHAKIAVQDGDPSGLLVVKPELPS